MLLEREKNEELQRQIDFLQKKLELETMKNENERQRKLKEQQEAEAASIEKRYKEQQKEIAKL